MLRSGSDSRWGGRAIGFHHGWHGSVAAVRLVESLWSEVLPDGVQPCNTHCRVGPPLRWCILSLHFTAAVQLSRTQSLSNVNCYTCGMNMPEIENLTGELLQLSYDTAGEFTRNFLGFVWAGVDGFVELAEVGEDRRLLTKADALNAVDPCRDQYFSLLPRASYGRSKADVVVAARLLWVDIDRFDGIDEALARVEVEPTFLYESGNKGYWAIWAIAESVGTDELEVVTAKIAGLVGGDRRSAERSRLGRIPGSLNRASGRAGRVISASWDRHPWAVFAHICGSAAPRKRSRDDSPSRAALRLEFRPVRTPASLTRRLQAYVNAHQTISQGDGGVYDRSAVEQSIFVCLLSQGHEPGAVLTLCRDKYRLTRLLEDLDSGNERRVMQSLASAIRWVEKDRERRKWADPLRPHRRRREFLQLCTTRRRTTELVALARSELSIGERQAYNLLRKLRDAGYLSSTNQVTATGKDALAAKKWLFTLPN